MHNEVLNAVLALLENRPGDARVILTNIEPAGNKLYARIARAIDVLKQRERRAVLVEILNRTATVEADDDCSIEEEEAFINALSVVEAIIQEEVEALDPEDLDVAKPMPFDPGR